MPVSSTSLRLLILPGMAVAALTGCATSNPCGDDPEYLAAQERPRLQMPEGVTGSERLSGGMNIPPATPDPAKLDPAPKCLDQPPAYFGPKAVMAGSVEEAVYVWASAWANRKPDQVASFYSPQFQANGEWRGHGLHRRPQATGRERRSARRATRRTQDEGRRSRPQGRDVRAALRQGRVRQGTDARQGRAGLAHRGRADAAEALTRCGALVVQ